MYVIGTAGHVDHGKSTLVEALTGIDPDRLREEKEREMTIVLGFAWLTLPGGESVGIIDVPGHKDFIKNMLSGVGGIDAALLVIAADEGVMPQTREHLAILDLLQVKGGVIALTKTDLVDDPEWIDLVSADVMEVVEGTRMEGAAIVPVSAHTGDGLDDLVGELAACLSGIEPRLDEGRPRLPVDRVFSIAGFGTVVTGTLTGGGLEVGQEIEIVPSGQTARIRGLQTHKTKVERALPGSRVAVNLTGVSKEDVDRGDVITVPGWLRATTLLDVQLSYLSDAPQPLKHNAEVDFFCGAVETPARVRLLGTEALAAGETGWAQLRLSRPAALVRGDRFILRWLSPSVTVGGGIVVDPAPRRRHRRFRPEVIERLETLASGTPQEVVLQALAAGEPVEARDLAKRLSLPGMQFSSVLDGMLASGAVLVVDDVDSEVHSLSRPEASARFLISAIGWRAIQDRVRVVLEAYHQSYPLRRGMPREELRSRLQERIPGLGGRLFNQIVARSVGEGVVGENEGSVWEAGHEAELTAEQENQVNALVEIFERAPYTTPSVSECVADLGEELFGALIEKGTLVRISADVVYLRQTLDAMRERVVGHIREKGSISIAQVRDLFGASRKYAVPLMEYLDQEGVTKRVGDARVLR